MFSMTIRVNIHPNKQQEFLQTTRALLTEIRKTNISVHYDLYRAVDESDQFCLVSKWHTQEELDQHFQTRYFGVLLGAMQVLGKGPDIQVDTISHTAGVEAVQAVRNKRS